MSEGEGEGGPRLREKRVERRGMGADGGLRGAQGGRGEQRRQHSRAWSKVCLG